MKESEEKKKLQEGVSSKRSGTPKQAFMKESEKCRRTI